MARIILPVAPPVSRKFITMVQQLVTLRDTAERTKDIADEITNGGVNKNALESAFEVVGGGAPLAAGQGAILYDAIVTILNAVGPNAVSVKAIIKQFDQG
jgi:oligoribonuclease NrnB/cAMP/cGMP phosphodiesterase (DHH superfamily)